MGDILGITSSGLPILQPYNYTNSSKQSGSSLEPHPSTSHAPPTSWNNNLRLRTTKPKNVVAPRFAIILLTVRKVSLGPTVSSRDRYTTLVVICVELSANFVTYIEEWDTETVKPSLRTAKKVRVSSFLLRLYSWRTGYVRPLGIRYLYLILNTQVLDTVGRDSESIFFTWSTSVYLCPDLDDSGALVAREDDSPSVVAVQATDGQEGNVALCIGVKDTGTLARYMSAYKCT